MDKILERYNNIQVGPITFDVITLLCVISNIQLASRHPANNGPSMKIATDIAKELQKLVVEKAPELANIIEKGWNPEFDVPA